MLQVIKHGHKGFYNTINNSLYFQLDLGFWLKKKDLCDIFRFSYDFNNDMISQGFIEIYHKKINQ